MQPQTHDFAATMQPSIPSGSALKSQATEPDTEAQTGGWLILQREPCACCSERSGPVADPAQGAPARRAPRGDASWTPHWSVRTRGTARVKAGGWRLKAPLPQGTAWPVGARWFESPARGSLSLDRAWLGIPVWASVSTSTGESPDHHGASKTATSVPRAGSFLSSLAHSYHGRCRLGGCICPHFI